MSKRIKGSSLIERSFVLPHPCLPWGQEGSPRQLPSARHICHCDLPKNNPIQRGSQQLSCRCQGSPSAAICLLDRPFWQGAVGKVGECTQLQPSQSLRGHSYLAGFLPWKRGEVQGAHMELLRAAGPGVWLSC